jgi:hypothetical protein
MNYNKMNRTICFYALIVLLAMPLTMGLVSNASAQNGLPMLSVMSPGSSKVNNFYINDIFSNKSRGPIAGTLIIAYGENSGTLKLTLQPKSTSKSFLFNITYSIYGIAYSTNGDLGPGNFISATENYYPNSGTTSILVTEIPINSNFGFALIGIIVNSTEYAAADDPTPPYPFTLKLELSETAPVD